MYLLGVWCEYVDRVEETVYRLEEFSEISLLFDLDDPISFFTIYAPIVKSNDDKHFVFLL